MFSKISRYKKLSDVVTTDARGRTLPSRCLRLLPEVRGTFLHTLEQEDRLDHLAYKYYQQPQKWWRICDANSEFMSPCALLGKDPIVTARFPVTYKDGSGQPPWGEMIKILMEKPGVIEVSVEEKNQLVEETVEQGGKKGKKINEKFEWALVITRNCLNISLADLGQAMEKKGFKVMAPEVYGRVGKKIVIPPDVVE